MQPSKTPPEIAELIEHLTGQPSRGNQAHTLWTHMWLQLDAIWGHTYLQTKYFEFFLTKELGFSADDIQEFLATDLPPWPPGQPPRRPGPPQ